MYRSTLCLTALLTSALLASGCGNNPEAELDAALRDVLALEGVFPVEPAVLDPAMVRLGQNFFFDKILSGNRDISCATCHTPLAATADGLSLSIGTGGAGLAQARQAPRDEAGKPILIPRNAPDVLGRHSLQTMFWDARVSNNGDGTFLSPAGADLPEGMTSALAVQALFPVTSRDEMRGQVDDNEIADVADDDLPAMWAALMTRLLEIEGYRELFEDAYPSIPLDQLHFGHAAEAIAAFENDVTPAMDSAFDRYLEGDDAAISAAAKRGGLLFYAEAGCGRCHSGSFFTDEALHNRAVPQIGPGKGDGADGTWDFGGEQVSGDSADRFMFRTAPLRNCVSTGPWMHDGAYTTLQAAVKHCMDPRNGLQGYDPNQLTEVMRATYRPQHSAEILAAVDPLDVEAVQLTDEQLADLMAFVQTLSSDSLGDMSIRTTPEQVPSGLPVAD